MNKLSFGLLTALASSTVIAQTAPQGVSTDLFEEAQRMTEFSQAPSSQPQDWQMTQNAQRQSNDITHPKGEWPLQDMGVPAPSDDPYNLYIIVTEEMPESLIRAYAFDALQTGGTLVIRGINPDEQVQDAMTRWGKRIVREDGAAPNMEIEPRVFSAFDIETAPAIVLSTEPVEDLCNMTDEQFSVAHDTAGSLGNLDYQTCAPAPADTYYKMTGSISVPWALKRMSETDEVPALQKTAKNWFQVLPQRYGTQADKFGWAGPMSEEDFANTSDEGAVRRHLEKLLRINPGLEIVRTDMGLGLGQKNPVIPEADQEE